MGDSQHENKKGNGKEKENYESWTIDDEVWEDYLKSHPSHSKLHEKSAVDYEELKIVFSGATTTRNDSIALGTNDTNATTFGEENKDSRMEDFVYDPINDVFIEPNHYELLDHSPSPHQCSPPSHSLLDLEVHTEKTSRNNRSRSKYEGNSTLVGTNKQAKVLENLSIDIGTIARNFEKISNLMEERERDRKRESNIWDAIKEIPNLEDKTWFLAIDLLNTKAKKDMFLSMSLEERFSWINFKLG
ncbi:uncharacterized protein At2g29880-like [Gastrolobium bilobum]|uniref:uncharacterized protein At2g29880-like n=1 Tax=Gastrolobium bilobum TaxID=150636 RepID=UPI002AAF40A1|nr:uncharacterized protein At2g29880-like [Gastrolobium bilobum]